MTTATRPFVAVFRPVRRLEVRERQRRVFAEYFHVNKADANVALIPDDVPDEKAVYCADMMSTGFSGAEGANIPIGGTVAIFAQGPVGLMATAGARLRGAGTIIAAESIPKRQQLARQCGADCIVDPSKAISVEPILALTDSIGAIRQSRPSAARRRFRKRSAQPSPAAHRAALRLGRRHG